MDRWDRTRQERDDEGDAGRWHASGAERRVHEPHRPPEPGQWRRDERPTRATEWEVAEFYESFDTPRP